MVNMIFLQKLLVCIILVCIGYNNGNAYRINFAFMSKNDALNLIKNAVIINKKGVL